MFSFNFDGNLSLIKDGYTVLKNIVPWFNTRLHPWFKDEENRIILAYSDGDGENAFFTDNEGACICRLHIVQNEDCFGITATGGYSYKGNTARGNHLNSFEGFGFDFDISNEGSIIDAYMNCSFWQRNITASSVSEIKPKTQAMIYRSGNVFACLMTTCDKQYKTQLFPCGGRCRLSANSNTMLDTFSDETVIVGGFSDKPYSVSEKAVAFGIDIMNKKGCLRKDKKYPEMFEYLGWCSWDAFHMFVTDRDLYDKAKEFNSKNIPVKWFIFDDMWGDVDGNNLKDMHTRELNSFEASPERFPNGLKGCIDRLKKDFDLKIGIWHPISGYWFGINPFGKLAKEHGDLLEYTYLLPQPRDPMLHHSFEREKMSRYYDIQHGFYSSCGADFTKIDNQSSVENFSHFKMPIGEATANLNGVIDETADRYYGGTLINCMGMAVNNFWNRKSAVNRFSGDFLPENRKWFIQHILQCSFNSLTQGAMYYGDYDMWWSDDEQALKNSVVRALSGGPIYMSDRLDCSVRDVIMPTVFSDGRIIRLDTPSRPSPDCLFENCETNGRIFKIFNRHGKYGFVAAFNIDENEAPVSGRIGISDALLPDDRYVIYDYFGKKASVADGESLIDLTLNDYDDFRLYIIAPIEDGTACLGLADKYNMPATFAEENGELRFLDDGTFVYFSEHTGTVYTKTVHKGEVIKKGEL